MKYFMLTAVLPALLLLLIPSAAAARRAAFACTPGGPTVRLPFCQVSLPLHARARDFVSRLTRPEKVRLLVNNAAGVPRLGVQGYEWWSEALHGVSNAGPGVHFGGEFPAATAFPQVIGLAATFNASLWERIGEAVSDEARAMYNAGQAGLTVWSPNINIFRDPRWGRGQETPGEDPAVAGSYAAAYVRGLQQASGGRHGRSRLKLAACCKHFTAYDLDNWNGVDRFHFNAVVSKQDLEDTFNVPFRSCVVDGGAAGVMCSYNQVNGVPTCADGGLLRGTVRSSWGLAGYIVSDCDSVGVFYDDQHFTRTPEDAVAATLKAGLDLDCGPFLAVHTESAVAAGKVTDADIDAALTNTVTVQMRLGMFDGDPGAQPFGHLGPSDVCTPAHQKLALDAARQSIVLLKNAAAAGLPLSPSHHRTVAVIGPNSDATATMLGNYAGIPCRYTTPLQGIAKYATALHRKGCTDVACRGNQPIGEAVAAARRADATVVVVGLDQTAEAETVDRRSLLLPGRQQELVAKVADAAGGPVVVVVMSGGPVDTALIERNPKVAAIVWAGYPGQAGGEAIADVVFGAHNPGGKLAVTWYPEEYVQSVRMTEMTMRADPARRYPGRTYRFYRGPVVYPFGHGLSYSRFQHSLRSPAATELRLAGAAVAEAQCGALQFALEVDVENVGGRDGDHTVMLFAAPPPPEQLQGGAPAKRLIGWEKVHLAAGRRAAVRFVVDGCSHLSYADSSGALRIPAGEHRLEAGEAAHTVMVIHSISN